MIGEHGRDASPVQICFKAQLVEHLQNQCLDTRLTWSKLLIESSARYDEMMAGKQCSELLHSSLGRA